MKRVDDGGLLRLLLSHSARSAWIETYLIDSEGTNESVALRKECVD